MCYLEIDETDHEALGIIPSELVGRLVAAQNHPIPARGQEEINNLCRTCRKAGKKGADVFITHARMVRAEVDCSTCESSK